MSNNKQSMKLYTHEEIVNFLKKEFADEINAETFMENLTPIELPSDEEVWRWWQTQKFQKEQGEQEYTMLYEIDLPKILKSFTEHLIQGGNK